jgi:RNA polymerase sigma factor (sigma-70 family)
MAVKNASYMTTNPDLYTKVYTEHYSKLRNQVSYHLGSRSHHSLDEVVDVAIERACQKVEQGHGVHYVAKNAVLEYKRRQRSRTVSYNTLVEVLESEDDGESFDMLEMQVLTQFTPPEISSYVNQNNYGEDPANQAAKEEFLRRLDTALDTLPYPTSAVLRQYYFEDMKQYQIGKALSLSLYRVGQHLERGIELLNATLKVKI